MALTYHYDECLRMEWNSTEWCLPSPLPRSLLALLLSFKPPLPLSLLCQNRARERERASE